MCYSQGGRQLHPGQQDPVFLKVPMVEIDKERRRERQRQRERQRERERQRQRESILMSSAKEVIHFCIYAATRN